jgi:hypothetical protein
MSSSNSDYEPLRAKDKVNSSFELDFLSQRTPSTKRSQLGIACQQSEYTELFPAEESESMMGAEGSHFNRRKQQSGSNEESS